MSIYTTEIASDKLISDNPIHQRLLKAYMEAKPYVRGRVLEPGCGEGRGLSVLHPLAEKYVALDKIQSALDNLTGKFPDVEFRQMHFPPFTGLPDSSFDTVITFQVIEHLQDDRLFLQEIHRVLKPGGMAVISTPNIKMSLSRNPWHVREYTSAELASLCRSIFRKVDMKGIAGNEKVMEYYEQNKASVNRIMRFDVFNLQYRLPAPLLRIPYDLLNRFNRNKLMHQDQGLVAEITCDDFHLNDESDNNLDLFCVVTK